MAGAAACLIVTTAAAWPEQESTTSPTDPRIMSGIRKTAQEAPGRVLRCPGARRGLEYWKRSYARQRAVQGLPGPPATVRYDCEATIRRASEWATRATIERYAAEAWVRDEYHWWVWMPRGSKEYRVASCETGYGRDPNWSHDSGSYVSAFGIYRAGYADDAARIGELGWDETIRVHGRVPTPRAQYRAMMSHRAQHGGWSGWGCRGA